MSQAFTLREQQQPAKSCTSLIVQRLVSEPESYTCLACSPIGYQLCLTEIAHSSRGIPSLHASFSSCLQMSSCFHCYKHVQQIRASAIRRWCSCLGPMKCMGVAAGSRSEVLLLYIGYRELIVETQGKRAFGLSCSCTFADSYSLLPLPDQRRTCNAWVRRRPRGSV